MDFLQTVLIFLLVVSIIVTVHEFGHFFAARLSGMRVDIFSIGMGPRLFGYNCVTGWSFGTLPAEWDPSLCTDYRVSLLPIGGYVKIAGMVDESLDTAQLKAEPKPWEFRAKPRFAQAFVISAGVLMNFLLAIGIFFGIALAEGKSIVQTTQIGYVAPESFGSKISLRPGDRILTVNGIAVQNWNHFLELLTIQDIGEDKVLEILRNGEKLQLTIPGKELVQALSEQQGDLGIVPTSGAILIVNVLPESPAQRAGLQPGDTVVQIADQMVYSMEQFIDLVQSHPNTPLLFRIRRGAQEIEKTVTPDSTGKIGVHIIQTFSNVVHEQYTIGEALEFSFAQTGKTIQLFVDSIVQIFRGKLTVKETLGGPIRIAEIASQQAQWGIAAFLQFVALLSITLAVINILPIPALDGGHLLIIVIEGLFRREIPERIKIAVQQIGIALLLLLMIFIIYNDLSR